MVLSAAAAAVRCEGIQKLTNDSQHLMFPLPSLEFLSGRSQRTPGREPNTENGQFCMAPTTDHRGRSRGRSVMKVSERLDKWVSI